ncbi:MAG TPA: 7TM diverse intracellular signaling domain-containing protein [Agriterribacter sp.]|nr:7TM diverse intracellular signaling domain-containing protein [Agriterribacter sp.]
MLPETLILGLILFQVFFSLAQWYFFRRTEYIYYAAYAITIGLYFFIKYRADVNSLLHVEGVQIYELFLDRSVVFIAFYFYIEFGKAFVNMNNTLPRLNKVVTGVGYGILAFALTNFIFTGLTHDALFQAIVYDIVAISLALFGICILYVLIKRNTILDRFLVLGSSMVIIGALLFVIIRIVKPSWSNQNTIIYFQVGVILELIFLNTGLLYKSKFTQDKVLASNKEKLKKLEENEKELISLQTMRHEISNELQMELGEGFSGIKLMTEMLKQRMGNEYSRELERISENSENLVQSMNEIVWSLNQSNDDLPAMLAYIREYAVNFLDQVHIICNVRLPEPIVNLRISGMVRRHIFLMIKEALNNIIKHANTKHVDIGFSIAEDFTIVISDHGKGIPESILHRSSGNGLNNMRMRAALLHGEMQISICSGTTIRFTIPLTTLYTTSNFKDG